MKNIELVVGDWSGDGHEKTSDIKVSCNYSAKEVEDFHKKGCEITGVNFSKWCCDYEDFEVSKEQIEKVLKYTELTIEQIYSQYKEDFDCYVDDVESWKYVNMTLEVFAHFYMLIAKIAKPELDFSIVSSRDNKEKINIGGYGLFY